MIAAPRSFEPLRGQRQQLGRTFEVPVGIRGVEMAEERGEQRQLSVNVGVFADTSQAACAAQRNGGCHVCGLGVRASPGQGRGAAEPIELVPDGALVQSRAGVGDQEARALRARAERVTDLGVAVERRDRGRVKRNLAGASVLPVADGEPVLGQLDVCAVQRDHLADPHAGHGQQPDQRLVGRGLQRRWNCATPLPSGRLDLGLGVQVGDRATELGWQQVRGGTSWRGSDACR